VGGDRLTGRDTSSRADSEASLRRKICDLQGIVSRRPPGALSPSELLRLLEGAERAANCARSCLALLPASPSRDDPPDLAGGFEPVEVLFSRGILRVRAPLTFKRPGGSSWHLAASLSRALRACGRIVIPPPVYAVVRRRAPAVHGSMRDNENLEVSRMLNALFAALGYSDRCDRVAYASVCETGPGPSGTFLTVLPASRIGEVLGELVPRGTRL